MPRRVAAGVPIDHLMPWQEEEGRYVWQLDPNRESCGAGLVMPDPDPDEPRRQGGVSRTAGRTGGALPLSDKKEGAQFGFQIGLTGKGAGEASAKSFQGGAL